MLIAERMEDVGRFQRWQVKTASGAVGEAFAPEDKAEEAIIDLIQELRHFGARKSDG